MKSPEVGIVLNQKAARGVRSSTINGAVKIFDSVHLIDPSKVKETDCLPERIIFVIGGESTINSLITELIKRKEEDPKFIFPIIVLAGGGSTNVLKRSLETADDNRKKLVLTWEDLKEIDPETYPKEFMFKPGVVFVGKRRSEREERVFNVEADAGVFCRMIGQSHEWRQKVPRLLRSQVVYARNLLGMRDLPASDFSNILDMVSVSQFLAGKNILPGQDLLGNNVAHAQINASSKLEALRKLGITLAFWQVPGFAGRVPDSILEVAYDLDEVRLNNPHDDIFVDGDSKRGCKGQLTFTRSKHSLPIVVLDNKKKK